VSLDRLATDAGVADVLHRLALAVEPVDAVTRSPADLVRVGRETSRLMDRLTRPLGRPGPADPAARLRPVQPLPPLRGHGSRFVLRHGPDLPETGPAQPPGAPPRGPRVRIRLDDARRRWVPRRLDAEIWTLAEVQAIDPAPDRAAVAGPYLRAASRLIRPWLLPGSAYAFGVGSTGLRLRVTRAGRPVPWVRVQAMYDGLDSIGWAHGDDRGEVLLLLDSLGPHFPRDASRGDITLLVHWPDPAVPAGPGLPPTEPQPAADPLRGLPVEPVDRIVVPPGADPPDGDVLRGQAVPAGYLTAPDAVRTLTLGEVLPAPDLVIA
jgi:hypothetical protein